MTSLSDMSSMRQQEPKLAFKEDIRHSKQLTALLRIKLYGYGYGYACSEACMHYSEIWCSSING